MAGAAATFLMDCEVHRSEETRIKEHNVTVINARYDSGMDKDKETGVVIPD